MSNEEESRRLVEEIDQVAKRLFKEKYGKRNPGTISSWELDDIKTKAAQEVQRRRQKS